MNRFVVARKVSIIGMVGNLFLFIIKIGIGLMSRSQSMIADAMNSAGDIFASLMTWIGNKISSVPNDDSHNYGHGKAEYIFSMLISISMMLVSFKLLIDSITSIIIKNQLSFSLLLCGTCVITIVMKVIMYLYTRSLYKKYNNLLVKANMIDHRNDCVITSFTMLAIILTKFQIYWFDGLVGIGISLWIFIVGVNLFKESYQILMDSAIDNDAKEKILIIIKSCEDIKRIGTLYSIPIGYHYIVVITIFVDGNMSTSSSHKIADHLEKEITNQVSKIEKVIVHIEPYMACDKKRKKLKI